MEKLQLIWIWLGWLRSLQALEAFGRDGTWSCKSLTASQSHWIATSSLNPVEPNTYVFGVRGVPPVIISLGQLAETSDCDLVLCDRGRMAAMSQGARGDSGVDDGVPCPRGLLSAESMRYFWLRSSTHNVTLGRAGQSEPLLSCSVPALRWVKLSGGLSFWIYGCTTPPPQPTLGCLYRTLTKRYDFSVSHPISEERVILADRTAAIRFLVRGFEDAHVRLRSPVPDQYYEIDLNFVGKIAIQQGIKYKDSSSCIGCLSSSEFRLFTVMYNQTDLWLLEGKKLYPRVSVKATPGSAIYNITSISFASMASAGTVTWLHGCRGEDVALQVALQSNSTFAAPDTRVVSDALRPLPAANQSVLEAALPGCRMVHTFKYRFDQYFALSEEGVVNGSSTMLPFRVIGRKDIHLQLVGEVPPNQDLYYEIDMDFYNHTNIDRAKELKVASVRQFGLLSPTELRGFLLEHDAVSGDLVITADDGKKVISWRDPRPFPLRYFSVSSGSSAGNDTTWVFGCPRNPPTPNDLEHVASGCSRPFLSHLYSHSQYFSVEREGVVNGSVRFIQFFLRANSSGHIRLEYILPPAVDAMFEVDLAHQGTMGIDAWGRTVVSEEAPPGLLSDKQLRGFWIRQDLSQRSLEVGQLGNTTPLISWTAPSLTRFLPMRFVSFTTSRVAGNATWVYGCKGIALPREDESAVGIPESSYEDEDYEEIDATYAVEGQPKGKQQLRSVLVNITKPPPMGTDIHVRFSVERVYVDDMGGMAVVRGLLEAVWTDDWMKWNPNEFDNIRDLNYVTTHLFWTPDFYMYKGDSELGGVLHLSHNGTLRWEAAAHLEAHCLLDGRRWPQDQHQCEMLLGLGPSSSHLQLQMQPGQVSVSPHAAAPFWDLRALSLQLLRRDGLYALAPATPGNNTIRLSFTLRRNAPVFHKILLAPYIVLAAMCLLAYWVPEPLPRDKVTLGCFALVLLVLSFLVLEAACPPGLIGIPLIVELYCWCLAVLVLNVSVPAVVSAIARECPTRRPPDLLCRLLYAPPAAWILLLPTDREQLRTSSSSARPDTVGYSKGSSQVYVRSLFDGDTMCSCSEGGCSKQSAMEARNSWSLLATVCERISSLLCWIFLIIAAFVLS